MAWKTKKNVAKKKKRAVKKVVKAKKAVVAKTRNSGTMTESAFFGFLRQNLRKASRYWKPVAECKKNSRRVSLSSNKRLKWEFKCAECENWFPEKDISVDHIVECGQLNNFKDLSGFTERLFVEVDGLQILCKNDHNNKTQLYRTFLKNSKINETI